jgi:hypothetical protein
MVYFNGISCSSVGNCTAVGDLVDSSNQQQGMVATDASGVFGTAGELSVPSNSLNAATGVISGTPTTAVTTTARIS